MKRILIILLFPVFLFAINISYEQPEMKEFIWLNGSWKMTAKKGVIIESWSTLNDSTMQGTSVLVKNNFDSIKLESITMVFRINNYYYIPKAEGQNENKAIAFKITSFDENSFVAENPNHDFPKRIIYRLITKDSIHAFIDGGSLMPEKRSDFYYSRIK